VTPRPPATPRPPLGPRPARAVALAALAAALLAACDDPPASAVETCSAEVRAGAVRTDVLFVIDESGSMSQEQQNLRAGLGGFVDALVASPVRNDFRVGVTTTSVAGFDPALVSYAAGPNAGLGYPVPYPAGALVAIARDGAGAPVTGRLDYAPATGFGGPRWLDAGSATLADDFRANVLLGTSGSGKEEPFRAARLALEARVAAGEPNAGFLRPGARLAVVFVTDEDDCSDAAGRIPTTTSEGNAACHDDARKFVDLDPVADFAAFLDGPIGGEARAPVVAVIAGVNPATLAPEACRVNCPGTTQACGEAFDDANRLVDLLGRFPAERTWLDSICNLSFGPALAGIAERLVPQEIPLEGAPPDPRMLAVSVIRPDGTPVACPVAEEGTPGAEDAGAIYLPPREGRGAALRFQPPCRLGVGDRVDLQLVCAG
jgi:hypothetical protein